MNFLNPLNYWLGKLVVMAEYKGSEYKGSNIRGQCPLLMILLLGVM